MAQIPRWVITCDLVYFYSWDLAETLAAKEPAVTIQDVRKRLSQIGFGVSHNLPERNSQFVGRMDILEKLHSRITRHQSGKVVLHGSGGFGKSQIALRYAWIQESIFKPIFWFNASSIGSIHASFLAIADKILCYYRDRMPHEVLSITLVARALGLQGLVGGDGQLANKPETTESITNAIKAWFEKVENTGWLLVYDGYNDPESFNIRQYVPSTSTGKIIITTRLRQLGNIGAPLEIELFSPTESLDLLLQSAHKSEDTLREDGISVLRENIKTDYAKTS